jgi:predicted DNA binding CopG/RHH family protein
MNKETEIRFRVSEEEKSLIKQKAKKSGMKLSEYVRLTALGDCIIKRNITEEIKIEK